MLTYSCQRWQSANSTNLPLVPGIYVSDQGSIGLGNGLSPARRQDITRTMLPYCQLGPNGQTSAKFESKFKIYQCDTTTRLKVNVVRRRGWKVNVLRRRGWKVNVVRRGDLNVKVLRQRGWKVNVLRLRGWKVNVLWQQGWKVNVVRRRGWKVHLLSALSP